MSLIVKVGEDGSLRLPAELLEQAEPNTAYVVERVNGALLVKPEGENTLESRAKAFWAGTTPEERAEDFLRWVKSHKGGPNLPLEALSRETMYD